MQNMELCLGIDAANIRLGGGRTYLIELLEHFDATATAFVNIVVWGSQDTLECLPDHPLITQIYSPKLDGSLLRRTLWQIFDLPVLARQAGCDILFVPGGVFVCSFKPIVTVSLNLLPFSPREIAKYGLSWLYVKFWLLRWLQGRSFKNSAGLIFLADYPRSVVNSKVFPLPSFQTVIPLGVSKVFSTSVRPQREISSYSVTDPYKIIYTSSLHPYKNHKVLIAAVAKVRESTGWPIRLDLVGPGTPEQEEELKAFALGIMDSGAWLHFSGNLPYEQLSAWYRNADLGVFSSSCENMPNILVEMMASGLPIVCSQVRPMPDILNDGGIYYDPLSEVETSAAITKAISDPILRKGIAEAGRRLSKKYTWEAASRDTFQFFERVAKDVTL
jgi:glycosyltransferase involved in cell wall biosynthesis